jgi:hypothetical protein
VINLTIRTGSQAGMEFPVDRPSVRIGRGSGNDIVLQDSQSSRHHAEISRQGDQFFIRDLGSTNGTFVNGQRITAPHPLNPGDQVRIGETTFACQVAGAAAAPAVGEDWESQLWTEPEAAPAAGRQKTLIWVLAGVVGVLVVAAIVTAVLLLGGGKETPTPVVVAPTEAATEAIVVAPTATPETEAVGEPTVTPLVEVSTLEPVPTVEVKATVPAVQPPSPPQPPPGVPSSPAELEQLPAMVTEILGDVPPDQLPDAIASQIQSLPPEQVQAMIGALFPGVSPDQLLPVVAASFPGLSDGDIQGLLNMVFPGQAIQVPKAGPIGGRIALGIHKEGQEGVDLYLVTVMGGQRTLVIEEGQEPGFSPDGQWLVYSSWAPDRLGLRLIKTDGTGDTALTSVQAEGYASFSPDGGRIAFHNRQQNSIIVINRDGSGRREITKGEYPAWSPAGDQIVYRGCLGGGRCGLIVANVDGSNPRQITTHANDAAPRWSPNGGQVVFHSDRDGNWEIYVINSDGSWLRRITLSPSTDVMPVWSPDGLRVAFLSDRGGAFAVYATSGIGGGAIKQFDANVPGTVGPWLKMDWSK